LARPFAEPLELLLWEFRAAQERGTLRKVGYPGELEDARKRSVEPTSISAEGNESLQITLVSVIGVEPQVDVKPVCVPKI